MNDFYKEIEGCSLDDLKLIFETQKELYNADELEIIQHRIEMIERKEKEAVNEWISRNLPKEIICPKCDGPNPFENDCCSFCGQRLDKKKYYNPDFYLTKETELVEDEIENGQSYTFQYIISFLIPLVGYILGAILLGKDDSEEKSVGKACIIIAVVSTIISVVSVGFLF